MNNDSAFFPEPWKKKRDWIKQHKTKSVCPIWGDLRNNDCWENHFPEEQHYFSPRAGGSYLIPTNISANLSQILSNDERKVAISKFIFDNNKNGSIVDFSEAQIEKILLSKPPTIDERFQSLLEIHDILAERASVGIFSSGSVPTDAYNIRNLKFAATSSIDKTDYKWLEKAAFEDGLLENFTYGIQSNTRLTPKGVARLSQSKTSHQSEQAFVAMWFSSEVENAYEEAIQPSIASTGYKPYRVDKDRSHSDQITNKILAEIKNSKFLIADFTHGNDGARGGVYFEAGYAMGLGIPVIWLIKNDGHSQMHFDTNHYPHIFWENEKHLSEELKAAILAHQHIGKGPL